jgi:hypothetical protein
MSKEEVERKLAEIKKIYGASIPAEIVEVKTLAVRESVEREIEPPFDAGIEVSEIEDDDSKA